MNPMLTLDVTLFEIKRSLTVGRAAIWCALASFPIAITLMLRLISMSFEQVEVDPEAWGMTLYFLIPEVICLLGLLLWATPSISTEVESQTWIYLAMRSSGRTWVVLGKYLTSVVWTFSAALVATTASVVIMGSAGGIRLWVVMSVLSLLSCFAHAALYLLIGLVFFRRTMVAAVAYTLVIEYGLSFVPALANKLTINYRLRGLLSQWMDWDVGRSLAENFFGQESASTHLMVLAGMTLSLLAISIMRTSISEFPTQQDG